MVTTRPSLQSIVDQPFGHGSIKDNIGESMKEAERLTQALASDRYSVHEFTQVMRYVTDVLHPLAIGVIIAKMADPESNRQLCYDAPTDKFKTPRAASLWAFLEVLPPEYSQLIPDRIIEFWVRHSNEEVSLVGSQIAKANRFGVPVGVTWEEGQQVPPLPLPPVDLAPPAK